MDGILWRMFEQAAGQHIPRVDEGMGVECSLNVPIDGLGGHSFQSWLARLPIKEKGMGLRAMEDTIPAAFIGSVEMSLPFLTGEGGQCQLLQPVIGDIRGSEEGVRWQALLQSGTRTGREFERSWERLQQEARQCVAYLGDRRLTPVCFRARPGRGETRWNYTTLCD